MFLRVEYQRQKYNKQNSGKLHCYLDTEKYKL